MLARDRQIPALYGKIWRLFSAYADRFTLLLALDNNPAPREALELTGLSSSKSKLQSRVSPG